MLKSFVELLQVYSDKTAISLRLSAIVAYPAHVERLSFRERKKRKLVDHKSTLYGILLAGIAELRVKDGHLEVHESLYTFEFKSSDVMPLKKVLPHTS